MCDGMRGLGASVSGTQVQATAAYSPWQKGRVEQRIATVKEVAGKTILQHQAPGRSAMSVVSYEVAHALNQRAYHSGVRARCFGRACRFRSDQESSGNTIPAHEKFESGTLCFFYRHYPGKRAEAALRGRHLGPEASIGPHGRSSWWVRFGGRAYLCATEHLRGVNAGRIGSLGH